MYVKYVKQDFDVHQFNSEMVALSEKISGLQHKDGILTVYLSQTITPQEKVDLDVLVTNHVPVVNQKELDEIRFQKRASAKDTIISKMAAGNLERVRNGEWSISDLILLTQDPELKALLDDVNTLSYEIAYSKVDAVSNPLLSQQIKDEWKALLMEHFYL